MEDKGGGCGWVVVGWAVEIGMELCDVETVIWGGGGCRRKSGRGASGRSLGFEIVVGSLSKGTGLQDFIRSVGSRTLLPEGFAMCVRFTTLRPPIGLDFKPRLPDAPLF